MERLGNIEKSAFKRGEYVGYACGVWRIRRVHNAWEARHRDDATRPMRSASTLTKLSAKLALEQ